MTDELLLATLARLENKIDRLADEVAELRGARKAVMILATFLGGVAGLVAGWIKGGR